MLGCGIPAVAGLAIKNAIIVIVITVEAFGICNSDESLPCVHDMQYMPA